MLRKLSSIACLALSLQGLYAQSAASSSETSKSAMWMPSAIAAGRQVCTPLPQKAEVNPRAKTLLRQLVAAGLVIEDSDSPVRVRGTMQYLFKGKLTDPKAFVLEEGGGATRFKSSRNADAPSTDFKAPPLHKELATGRLREHKHVRIIKNHGHQTVTSERLVHELLPMVSLRKINHNFASVTMLAGTPTTETIRISPVTTSHDFHARKEVGDVVDLVIERQSRALISAFITAAGCEGTDVHGTFLQYSNYVQAGGRMVPQTIRVEHAGLERTAHVAAVEVLQ